MSTGPGIAQINACEAVPSSGARGHSLHPADVRIFLVRVIYAQIPRQRAPRRKAPVIRFEKLEMDDGVGAPCVRRLR